MIHTCKVLNQTPDRTKIFVDKIQQLFDSVDPSPVHEKDFDHNTQEFIVRWVNEYRRSTPLALIHINQSAKTDASPREVSNCLITGSSLV